MKKWIVRLASLLVFNVVVLLAIGFFTPARVGWNALWAGLVMTGLVVFIKPVVEKLFRSFAARRPGDERSRIGEKLSEFVVALAVAAVIWIGVVLLSGVSVRPTFFGILWGYLLPPLILLIGWAVYDVVDDRIEARAGTLYDRATRRGQAEGRTDAAAPPIPQAPSHSARRDAGDGLTDEQRRMLDDLGRR